MIHLDSYLGNHLPYYQQIAHSSLELDLQGDVKQILHMNHRADHCCKHNLRSGLDLASQEKLYNLSNFLRISQVLRIEKSRKSYFSKKCTYGQNQGGGWRWGREVGLAGVGWRGGEKMQTTVIEQQ